MSKHFWEIRRGARCFAELFWINNWETMYAVIKMGCMKCIKFMKSMKSMKFMQFMQFMKSKFQCISKKIDSEF